MDGTKLPLFVIFKRVTSNFRGKATVLYKRMHGWTTKQCLSRTTRSINLTLRITLDILVYYWSTLNAIKPKNQALTSMMQCVLRFLHSTLVFYSHAMLAPTTHWRLNWIRLHLIVGVIDMLHYNQAKRCLSLTEKIWDEFSLEIVKNSFLGSRYCYIDGIDYSGETESESDLERVLNTKA